MAFLTAAGDRVLRRQGYSESGFSTLLGLRIGLRRHSAHLVCTRHFVNRTWWLLLVIPAFICWGKGSEVHGHHWLQNEFDISQSYMRPFPKKKKKELREIKEVDLGQWAAMEGI